MEVKYPLKSQTKGVGVAERFVKQKRRLQEHFVCKPK